MSTLAGAGSRHDHVLRLALSGHADARRQARVLAELRAHGSQCPVDAVVAALCAGVPPEALPGDADVDRLRSRLRALGARLLVLGDDAYPRPLVDAWPQHGPPLWLFATGGDVVVADRLAVAVVGTRRPTADGVRTATLIAGALAGAGVVVVSGLARGIDQAAHRGALDAGGRTVAVLGAGVGVEYPRGSAPLAREITASGAVLTEYPPAVPPAKWRFLARNRIIAGLCVATVVVEGRQRSGALHTAGMAAEQGRDVWAAPGSINAPASAAPLALLADGATPLTSVEALLSSLPWPRARDASGSSSRSSGCSSQDASSPGPAASSRWSSSSASHGAARSLSQAATAVLELLGPVPASSAALGSTARLPAREVLVAVAELVDAGLAVATTQGVVRA